MDFIKHELSIGCIFHLLIETTEHNRWMQLTEYGYTWTFSKFDVLGDKV